MSPRDTPVRGFRALLVGLLAVGLCAAAATPAMAAIKVGDVFPALPAASESGHPAPTTAEQILLVDFWASWCAPCKASFPAFARLHHEYASRGVVIVAVSVDDRASDYDRFVKKQRPPFSTVRDEGKRLVTAVEVPAMPTSYLIGRDGRVRFVHAGFHGAATEKELRAEIDALLAE